MRKSADKESVRKRIAIVVVVLVVGAGACLLSQPRKRTVEYHKEQFLRAGMLSRREAWVVSHTPGFLEARVHQAVYARKMKQHDFHRDALVDLGYLDKRTCYVRNHEAKDVVGAVMSRGYREFLNGTNAGYHFFGVSEVENNRFTFVALREEMERWQKVIREADVPTKE